MTPTEVINRFSSKELTEQMAFERIHPFGDDRTEFLLAQLTALFVASKQTKRGKTLKFDQFLPWRPRKRQTLEEMLRVMKGIR